MRLIASAVAALAATAAFAAPASADHYETTIDRLTSVEIAQPYHPCLTDITLPNCVNWALDEASMTLEELRRIYNEEIQATIDPQYCKVHYILSGEPCPDRTPTL